MKRYLFLLLIFLTACGTGPKRDPILNTLPTPFPTAELLIAPPEMATPTKWLSPLSATTMAIYGPRLTEIAVMPPVTNPIRIDGVTYGLYGKDVTWSLGTDGEITSIGYFIPSGNYRAVNNRAFRDQINVYSPVTVWEDGYEYAADGHPYPVMPNETIDIYVPFGWYVKVVPPTDFTLTPLRTSYSASTPVPKDPSAIHMPKNIYSPTPKPDRSKGITSSSCSIKGNVNSNGERIYHCQGWRDYNKTDMNPAEGDTWFCSVADAKAAGFRAAEYPHGICIP